MAVFEIQILEIFCQINLYQTVEIYVNNLDCKMLILEHRYNISVRIGGKTFCIIFRSSVLEPRVED